MVDCIPVVGKKYRAIPDFTYKSDKGHLDEQGELRTGVCVYVHPKLRFAVLSFGGIRESYFFQDMQ